MLQLSTLFWVCSFIIWAQPFPTSLLFPLPDMFCQILLQIWGVGVLSFWPSFLKAFWHALLLALWPSGCLIFLPSGLLAFWQDLLLVPAGLVSVLDCSVYDTPWWIFLFTSVSTPHSASRLGKNAFFGVRFLCLRHFYVHCSVCICVNACRFSVCACCFLVDFSVHFASFGFFCPKPFSWRERFSSAPAGLALLLAPAGFVSVLDCSVYDTSWWIVLFTSVSTPHSASHLGENVFFGVRFFCLRHFFANCSVCICVNTRRFSICACCFLVDFSVHSNHLDFPSEILELFRGSVSGLSLRGVDPTSLFATRSRPLASRLFECRDENSVSVLDCLLCLALDFVSLDLLLWPSRWIF